jgi:hypothetical protein
MTVALFITVWPTETSPTDLSSDFLYKPPAFFREAMPEIVSVDLFMPETGGMPRFDGSAAPALMLQIDMMNAPAAEALAQSDIFRRAYRVPAEKVTFDVFETVHFMIPGHQTPTPRTAPLSFIVRYYGPTEDGAAFVRFYTKNHPQILATLPEVRNVSCYLPPDWQSIKKVSDSRVILGNEVAFDDLNALNRALASDVMPRLIADGRRFAEFGFSTHHAMRRERVYTRAEN